MTDIPPPAAPGWYPLPSGERRYWNGVQWAHDPPRVLDAALSAPGVPYAVASLQTPGWYPGPSGMTQWWDGSAWGPFAPVQARPSKEVGMAYLFLLLLGGFSAHRFYLGRTGSAVFQLCLWVGGWLLAALLIGIPMLIAGGIWLLVDLFLLPSMVREENAKRVPQW